MHLRIRGKPEQRRSTLLAARLVATADLIVVHMSRTGWKERGRGEGSSNGWMAAGDPNGGRDA